MPSAMFVLMCTDTSRQSCKAKLTRYLIIAVKGQPGSGLSEAAAAAAYLQLAHKGHVRVVHDDARRRAAPEDAIVAALQGVEADPLQQRAPLFGGAGCGVHGGRAICRAKVPRCFWRLPTSLPAQPSAQCITAIRLFLNLWKVLSRHALQEGS